MSGINTVIFVISFGLFVVYVLDAGTSIKFQKKKKRKNILHYLIVFVCLFVVYIPESKNTTSIANISKISYRLIIFIKTFEVNSGN